MRPAAQGREGASGEGRGGAGLRMPSRRKVVLKVRDHAALPLSIPEPRGTLLSPWPPCGCGDEVREVGVTRRIATGEQGGLAPTPFSLLCKEGPWKSVCQQEEGSGAGLRRHLPAPRDTETHSNPIRPAVPPACPQRVEDIFCKRLITVPSVLPS